MNKSLSLKKCVPCEGGVMPLSVNEINKLLEETPGWEAVKQQSDKESHFVLKKRFQFNNFKTAMVFLTEVSYLAEGQGHHPDFSVHYNKVDFTVWTHAIKGLHQNDFIIASGIEKIAAKYLG